MQSIPFSPFFLTFHFIWQLTRDVIKVLTKKNSFIELEDHHSIVLCSTNVLNVNEKKIRR